VSDAPAFIGVPAYGDVWYCDKCEVRGFGLPHTDCPGRKARFSGIATLAEACTKTGYGVGGERLRYIDADEFVRLLREEASK
jgi:hypothetical protein